jgi:hypothetical protein
VVNDKLQEAIAQIKSGDNKAGYRLLVEVIKANPKGKNAETAWLWMSVIVTDPKKKRQSLETVLTLNPDNETAKKRLAQLNSLSQVSETRQTDETPPKLSNQEEIATKKCPFCAETIKAEAIVCRFCGHELTDRQILSTAAPKSQIANYQQTHTNAGVEKDIKDVGKTTMSVAFGILSAPIVAVILSLFLLMLCCGSCYFLGELGSGNGSSRSVSPSNTRNLPPTYTPISRSSFQPRTQVYSGVGREVELVRVPDGYNVMKVVMLGDGFSYFEVWSMDDDLLMDGSCERDECVFSDQIRLSGVGNQVEIVFNAVEYFGSLEGEAWAAEVTFIE